jgi:hypothetical protein
MVIIYVRESVAIVTPTTMICNTMFKVMGRCFTLLCDCVIKRIQLNNTFFRACSHDTEQVLFQMKRMYIFIFEVLTAVAMKNPDFCIIAPCSLVKVNRYLGRIYNLRLQGRRVSQVRNQHEESNEYEGYMFVRNVG